MQSKLFDIFIQTIGMKGANGLGVFGFLKFKHASILVKTGCGLSDTGYELRVTGCELRVAGCGLRVAGHRRMEHIEEFGIWNAASGP
jgi:hypothetical protein